MSLWENENNQNENGEQNNDAMEANFTVKDSGNENAGDTTDEKPTYVFENLYGLEKLETRINKYNDVTKKDIMNFAKKIKLNTILCVRDGENERNKDKQN